MLHSVRSEGFTGILLHKSCFTFYAKRLHACLAVLDCGAPYVNASAEGFHMPYSVYHHAFALSTRWLHVGTFLLLRPFWV